MDVKNFIYKQGVAIKAYSLEAQGVCWELCRRWVAGHLAGTWKLGTSVWDVDTGVGGFTEVLEVHRQRRDYTEENKAIESLSHQTSARRTRGCCRFQGLRSRDDVIDHVVAVPGVFIFVMTGPSGGHAMAFDSRAGAVEVFDPNQGEWRLTNASNAELRAWWRGFWDATGDGGVDYKSAFHRGERELIRYNTIE